MTTTSLSAPHRICSRCVYDSSVPNIVFDDSGVCNYCHQHDRMCLEYPNDQRGQGMLAKLVEEMKAAGKGKKYDCLIGVSGGCDSSYLVHKMVEMGVRPLAVHFDNTWNSPIATQNIQKVLSALNVNLYTYVVDNREFDDIFKAFLYSGVKECDAATDIALTTTMYLAAQKYGIKHIVEGHSFRTEGIAPLGWAYMDGKYIIDIHNKFGSLKRKTFPNLTLARFLKWNILYSFKRVRPLYYIDYDKEAAKKLLHDKYGWQWYGGHHLENRIAIFGHTYWLPYKHKCDQRVLGHAALVRSGQLTREDALERLSHPIRIDNEILALVCKRLSLSEADLQQIFNSENKHWTAYRNYKKHFERLKPLFWVLLKMNRIPKSFYLKFASK